MNPTLHLFRDDVRRLRWWLLGWAIFWAGMLAMSGDIPAGPADLTEAFLHYSHAPLSPVLVANVLHAALLVVLVALLIIPHGPADPRLFWRTRPVEARDVLRAKALFIGLFLIAYPVGAEVVFWLGWLPVRDVLLLVPSMLGERLAWSAGVTVLVVLGERDARRYQLAVVGLLALGMVWTYAGDQFLYAYWESLHEESLLPVLSADGFRSQLWTFIYKGPNRAVIYPGWLKWVPAVTLGVSGWFVVGCRYLAPGWRATRIAGLVALLVALVAGHAGVRYERRIERWVNLTLNRPVQAESATELVTVEYPHDPYLTLPMNAQAAALKVELRRVLNLGFATNWYEGYGIDFGEGKVAPMLVKPQWNTAATPAGIVALVHLKYLRSVTMTNESADRGDGGWFDTAHLSSFALSATNELTAALSDLAGYQLTSGAYPWGNGLYMNPKVTGALELGPQVVEAELDVVLAEVSTVVKVSLRKGASGRVGAMRLNVRLGHNDRNEFVLRCLVTRQPYSDLNYSSLTIREEPVLFIFRNPTTKEAFTMDWRDVSRVRTGGYYAATLLSPGRRRSFSVWNRPLTASDGGDGLRTFTEAWLDQAEVLGVRLRLVGVSRRTMRLENFQLEPAGR